MFEPKARVILLAGLGFFALSFLVMGLFPWTKYNDRPEISVTELAEEGMTHEFIEWAERFPERFNRHFPDGATTTSFAEALQLGRDVYVAEACWHCHTQQVRPVSTDRRRGGPASR
ncbi:MAG: cbb3-type cytochrome c oxidase subunit II, partial [Planctomycetes bacterium]|nr:cbb3-type cytochrome c oxidase subunit II [Planctomycetota bacterium]